MNMKNQPMKLSLFEKIVLIGAPIYFVGRILASIFFNI